MNKDRVGEDVEIFLTQQMQDFVDDELLPDTEDCADLVQCLKRGADGMFLWATLMCRFLRSPALTPSRRARTIREVVLPEGLEQLYDRILHYISRSGTAERSLVQQILLWLSQAREGLDSVILEQAVLSAQGDDPEDDTNKFEDFVNTAIVTCAGLVETSTVRRHRAGNDNGPYHDVHLLDFVHLSIREYFQQSCARPMMKGPADDVLPPMWSVDMELTCQFLNIIKRSAPSPTSQPRGIKGALHSRLSKCPLLRYACCKWNDSLAEMHHFEADLMRKADVDHLHRLASAIEEFLGNARAVSLWLEAVLTTGELRTHQVASWANWIRELPQSTLASSMTPSAIRLLAFSEDIKGFVDAWGTTLREDPSIIWNEATFFVKSAFLFHTSTDNFHRLDPRRPSNEGISTRPLCTSSATDRAGQHSVTLSIWPCKMFEDYWLEIDPLDSYSEIECYCTNWTAHVEVWSVEGLPHRVADFTLNLDATEIALQMRQSFRAEGGNDWKTSFPHWLDADSQTVVILRTLYRLTIRDSPENAQWQSVVLPLDFTPRLKAKWDNNLFVFNPRAGRLDHVPVGLHFIHRQWYTYSMVLSSDGSRLFFADYHPSFYHHVAVFDITSGTDLSVSLVASDQFYNHSGRGRRPPRDAVFYSPTSVAFCFAESVWLWEYMLGMLTSLLRTPCNELC